LLAEDCGGCGRRRVATAMGRSSTRWPRGAPTPGGAGEVTGPPRHRRRGSLHPMPRSCHGHETRSAGRTRGSSWNCQDRRWRAPAWLRLAHITGPAGSHHRRACPHPAGSHHRPATSQAGRHTSQAALPTSRGPRHRDPNGLDNVGREGPRGVAHFTPRSARRARPWQERAPGRTARYQDLNTPLDLGNRRHPIGARISVASTQVSVRTLWRRPGPARPTRVAASRH
jgi:hypothetical protein